MELLDPSSGKKSPPHDLLPTVPRKHWKGKLGAILRFPFKTRRRKVVTFTLLALLLLFLVIPALLLYPAAVALKPKVGNLQAALSARNLTAAQENLGEVVADFNRLEKNYSFLFYFKAVPFLSLYYGDGTHLLAAGRLALDSIGVVVEAIKPYEDVLGLKVGFGSQITVEQQISRLVDTLPKLADGLDAVWGNVGKIREEIGRIDPQRYPEELGGIKIRFWLEEGQSILEETEPLVSQGRQILEVAPALLGSPKRNYLVLFQNDGELRATGGFITGFSILTIQGGNVLDNTFHTGAYFAEKYPPEMGAPPRPIAKYLVPRGHFQDANFWPDFPTTAKAIMNVWAKSGLPKISGVVAINTEAVADLLEVVGSIHIPGYDLDLANTGLPADCRSGGRDFTSENLVCRLEYYVEKAPQKGKGTEARKIILDLISDAVIKKISNSSAEIWPKLVDFVFNSFDWKNLMIYAAAQKEQDLLMSLDFAGQFKEFSGDYLHINDSNFGGLKTDLYMTEEVEQSLLKQEDGTWRKTVNIKYYNPVPYDGWLSGYYKDFVRIYVPQGSKLVSVDGSLHIWTYKDQWATSIQNPSGWEENGKTVFGTYFTLAPQEEHTLTFVYDLPSSVAKAMEDLQEYQLLLQKQSGTNIGLVKVQIGDTIESVELSQDREITIPLGR